MLEKALPERIVAELDHGAMLGKMDPLVSSRRAARGLECVARRR
ncbi:MAG TPA: hypothetical protein VGD71_04180 [Kribbella sp.]|jgi:hypothetical protein